MAEQVGRLKWDQVSERLFETGTSHAILFPQAKNGSYETGVAWNGMISAKQSPDGAEETPKYADNIKYLSMFSAENMKGTIEAFTYPEEFELCDGSVAFAPGAYAGQQNRKAFALVYSTIVGNDTEDIAYGEKIHIIYNAKVSPSERAYETINETPNAITFSWGYTTTPVSVDDIPQLNRPTSYVNVDSTKLDPVKFTELKDMLYGSDTLASKLPTLKELVTMLEDDTAE